MLFASLIGYEELNAPRYFCVQEVVLILLFPLVRLCVVSLYSEKNNNNKSSSMYTKSSARQIEKKTTWKNQLELLNAKAELLDSHAHMLSNK